VIDAQHDGKEEGQQEPVGGKVAIGDVSALEAVVGAPAVEHASAIGVRAGIQDVSPVRPGHRR